MEVENLERDKLERDKLDRELWLRYLLSQINPSTEENDQKRHIIIVFVLLVT